MVLVFPLPSEPTNVNLIVRDGANPQADCLANSIRNELLSLASNLSMETNSPLLGGQENFLSPLMIPSVSPNFSLS